MSGGGNLSQPERGYVCVGWISVGERAAQYPRPAGVDLR